MKQSSWTAMIPSLSLPAFLISLSLTVVKSNRTRPINPEQNMQITNKKTLTVFGLVMLNVIAIDSLRTLPMSAEYGFSLVFYYLVAALFFFIPVALVSA